MIPQNLIEKIHQGNAEYKTFVLGMGGSSIIQIPKKSYIVITSFTFHHFIDRKDTHNLEELAFNVVHNLQFRSSNKNRYNYTFRTNIQNMGAGTWVNTIGILNPAETRQCYQVHDSNIYVECWRMKTTKDWTNLVRTDSLIQTNNENTPLGYGSNAGTSAPTTVRAEIDSAVSEYQPQGALSGYPQGNQGRNQFINNINKDTALHPIDTTTLFQNFSFPIINIDYILVSEQTTSHVK